MEKVLTIAGSNSGGGECAALFNLPLKAASGRIKETNTAN